MVGSIRRVMGVCALAAAVMLIPIGSAKADLASFNYDRLVGGFNGGTSTFQALNGGVTLGSVVRGVNPGAGQTANFNFNAAGIGVAAVSTVLNVTNITMTTASGSGTLILRDVDG